MSYDALLVHTVDILTASSTTSDYGDAEADWDDTTSVESKARMVQRTATEVLGDREASVTQWVAFLPPEVTVTHANRIVWDDLTFEVAGDPKPACRRTANVHHWEVPLARVSG